MFRGWVFTINNFTEADLDQVKTIECRCIVAGMEGEGKTPHIQGAVYFESKRSLAKMKKIFPRAHLEPMRGTWADQAYCEKEGNVIRKEGDPPSQGKRTDVLTLKRKLDEGGNLEDCFEEDFGTTTKIYKALEKYQDVKKRKMHRTEMTKGLWLYGPTGTGKSHQAFKDFDPDTHYVWKDDKGWWDAYDGHKVVIMNDFRGQIPYGEMLNLVDKWPYSVSRRGREPTPFLAERVVVTSSLHPEQIYKKRDEEDKIEQLMRRFEIQNLMIKH